jgi:hypothetical protein
MAAVFESIIDFVLAMALGPADQDSSNRVWIEGLTFGSRKDGALEIRIRRFKAASFRLASGPLMLELGHLALQQMVALVRIEAGRPRPCALEAASAQLSGVKVHGPLILSRQPKGDLHALHAQGGASASGDSTAGQATATSWCLAPLAGANGSIRAEIIDAHLLFDADVTVPIRQGQVKFNDATVEHVGPDSRMGVSRLGIYVDAPNGRSYLYQFSSAPVAGVEYERRDAMLGPRVTSRGNLQLQEFGEGLLHQPRLGQALGFTEQTRRLFDRTAVSGEVRLSDGRFAAPAVQADLVGRADGRNVVRLHSEAVGRGLTVDMTSLAVRNAVLSSRDKQVGCDEIAGKLMLRLFVEDGQSRFAFDLANMDATGLNLQLDHVQSV